MLCDAPVLVYLFGSSDGDCDDYDAENRMGRLQLAMATGCRCLVIDCIEIDSGIFIKTLGAHPVSMLSSLHCIRDNAFVVSEVWWLWSKSCCEIRKTRVQSFLSSTPMKQALHRS